MKKVIKNLTIGAIAAGIIAVTSDTHVTEHHVKAPAIKKQTKKKLTSNDWKQITCLAKNIYHEARGESKREQISVGYVTLNRVSDKRFPNTVCEVVHQPYQFSWTLMSDKHQQIKEKDVFENIVNLAKKIYLKEKQDPTQGATHYYSHKIMKKAPKWASAGENILKFEAHTYMALNW